jgi:hypothetical protein
MRLTQRQRRCHYERVNCIQTLLPIYTLPAYIRSYMYTTLPSTYTPPAYIRSYMYTTPPAYIHSHLLSEGKLPPSAPTYIHSACKHTLLHQSAHWCLVCHPLRKEESHPRIHLLAGCSLGFFGRGLLGLNWSRILGARTRPGGGPCEWTERKGLHQ